MTQYKEELAVAEKAAREAGSVVMDLFKGKFDIHEGRPVGINPPSTVDLEVVDTEPSMKGATASASYKPAKLETGVTVQVPPFVQVGDKVRVDPTDGSYLERVK